MNLKLDKKLIDKLSERLDVIEEEPSGEETDARFAKMRLARAKNTNAHGDKTYEDVRDEITQ